MNCSNYLFVTIDYAYSYGGCILSQNYSVRPSLMARKYYGLYEYHKQVFGIFLSDISPYTFECENC